MATKLMDVDCKATSQRNIQLLSFIRVCGLGMSMGIPSITQYWVERGLTLSDFFLLQFCFCVGLAAFEVATGRFADLYGRASSVRLGTACVALGAIGYAISGSFTHFLISEGFFALGLSLISGAEEALVYDSLLDLGRAHEFSRVWRSLSGIGFWAMACGAVLGGILAEVDLRIPFALGAALIVASFCATCFLTESSLHQSQKLIDSSTTADAVGKVLCGSTELRWLVIFPGIVRGFNQPAVWLYGPFMLTCGMSLAAIGVAFCLFHLIASLASRSAGSVSDRIGVGWTLALPICAVATSYFFMGSFSPWFGVLFILPQQWVRGFSNVTLVQEFNDKIPTSIRATATSVRNMVYQLWYLAATAPCILFADQLGREKLSLLLGASLLLTAVSVWACFMPRKR